MSLFNDTKLLTALGLLPTPWLHAEKRTPLEVLEAVYGPYTTVIEYDYDASVRAFVVTCMSTHRAFLMDTSRWSDPSARLTLMTSTFDRYDEAPNLLRLAAAFADEGYAKRQTKWWASKRRLSAADRFVLTLTRRWYESRAVMGDDWNLSTATVFATMTGAAPVAPYLPAVFGTHDLNQ
jgi:hypothetical protein